MSNYTKIKKVPYINLDDESYEGNFLLDEAGGFKGEIWECEAYDGFEMGKKVQQFLIVTDKDGNEAKTIIVCPPIEEDRKEFLPHTEIHGFVLGFYWAHELGKAKSS
jgi:hypothetical protein